jgi:hypothetical protein
MTVKVRYGRTGAAQKKVQYTAASRTTHTVTVRFLVDRYLSQVPADEVWLWNNPKALASVMRGLEQSKQGKTRYTRSYAKYADIEID